MIPCPRCGTDNDGVAEPCSSCGGSWAVSGIALVDLIGTSAWSRTYLAEPDAHGARAVEVSLERLSSDEAFREAFQSEGTQLITLGETADLAMPQLFAVGMESESSACFAVREHVPAETLEGRLMRGAAPTPRELLAGAVELGKALSSLHSTGLVHGGVCASSLLFPHEQDGTHRVLLSGAFPGLRAAPADEHAGAKPGSLDYQCPERVSRGDLGPAGDQYSLAIVLYRTLTGHFPAEGGHAGGASPALLREHLLMNEEERAAAIQDLPEPLRPAFAVAMAREPQDRHASVGVFTDALSDTAQELPPDPTATRKIAGPGSASTPAGVPGVMRPKGGAGPGEETSQRMASLRAPRYGSVFTPRSESAQNRWWWLILGTVLLVGGVLWLAINSGEPSVASKEVLFARARAAPRLDEAGDLLQQVALARRAVQRRIGATLSADLDQLLRQSSSTLAGERQQLDEERTVEGVVEIGGRADREVAKLEAARQLLHTLGQALDAQRAASLEGARIHARLDEPRSNVNELLDIGGGGLDLVLADVARIGERLDVLIELDLARLRQSGRDDLARILGRAEAHLETLTNVGAHIDKACEEYDLALAAATSLTREFGDNSVRVFDEAELAFPPAGFAAVERWLQTENEAFDVALAQLKGASRSSEASRVAERLREVSARMAVRADELTAARVSRQREELVHAVEARLPVIESLLAETEQRSSRGDMDEACGRAVQNLEQEVAAYQAAVDLITRAEVAERILQTGDVGQRCLSGLFLELANRRRAELEAVMAGADDGSERFKSIRATYHEAMAKSDVSMNPLETLSTYNDLEFSVYKHLGAVADTLHVDLEQLRAAAMDEPSLPEPVAGCTADLAAFVQQLEEPAPDLIAIARAMTGIRARVTALEIRIENALHRLEAIDLRAEAVAMELRLKEIYYGRAMRTSEEDLYQTGVILLGEGRVKFESGDYSGAKASFKVSMEHFSKIRR